MRRLAHGLLSVAGFAIALVILCRVYHGPTDNNAVRWGLVCLAVMFGTWLDLLIRWAWREFIYVVACIGVAGWALGKRQRV